MNRYKTLFVTQRGERHQQAALDAAPPELDVIMRRTSDTREIIALLPEVDFLISERTGIIDADVIAAGRRLRLIQRLGSQSFDIDLDAARAKNIPVCLMPVRTCARVTSITLDKRGDYVVAIDGGDTITTHNVVMATGLYQTPKIPRIARDFPAEIKQLHSDTQGAEVRLTRFSD